MQHLAPEAMAFGSVMVIVYALFIAWYGGKRPPVTAAQAEKFLQRARAQMAAGHGDEHPEFRANLDRLIANDDGREFWMINLETNKPGTAAKQAGDAYGRLVLKLLLKRGGHPVFLGKPRGPVYGDVGTGIDRVAIVRYRSLYDLLDMIADPKMADGAPLKFAALAHTEVFAVSPAISALTMRLTVGLFLLLLTLVVGHAFS